MRIAVMNEDIPNPVMMATRIDIFPIKSDFAVCTEQKIKENF